MPDSLPLLAVPNVSEGRDHATLDAIAGAFTATGGARLLDRHRDPDHHRAVFTLAGGPRELSRALLGGLAEAVARVDIRDGRGAHPHVGAVDVVPIVYLAPSARGAACAEALLVADRIGSELAVPVFLYGALARGRTRAELRRGGAAGLRERLRSGEQRPDFGPPAPHPSAGATLVAAREPLVAFNLELAAPATLARAREIAALIREGGVEGLAGLRAIGVELRGRGSRVTDPRADASPTTRAGAYPTALGSSPGAGAARAVPVAQVSMNVERPYELPLAAVVAAVRAHAEVAAAEVVGLLPRVALAGFPREVPLRGFDPTRQVIENALGL